MTKWQTQRERERERAIEKDKDTYFKIFIYYLEIMKCYVYLSSCFETCVKRQIAEDKNVEKVHVDNEK